MSEVLRVGLVSASDRASGGVYKDEGIPSLKAWLAQVIRAPALAFEERLIPDERAVIEASLVEKRDDFGAEIRQRALDGAQDGRRGYGDLLGLARLKLEHSPAVGATAQFRADEGQRVQERDRKQTHPELAECRIEHQAVD